MNLKFPMKSKGHLKLCHKIIEMQQKVKQNDNKIVEQTKKKDSTHFLPNNQ